MMNVKEILKINRLQSQNPKCKKVIINVMHVQKCNFNDTFYIKDLEMNLEELIDQPLKWFDPYLGLSKKSKIEVAIAFITNERIFYLEKENDCIKVIEKELIFDYILCEDLDERLLLATHIRMG